MKIIEILIWVFVLSYVFSFGSTIFMNSSENIDTFWNYLEKHTKNISEISQLELSTWNCIEKGFTGVFLSVNLTWYFCNSQEKIFNWQVK